MSERENINAIKQHYHQDLSRTCLEHEKIFMLVQADAKFHRPNLAQDSANLARYDLAFAEFLEPKEATEAGILLKDGVKRIQQAARNGVDMRDLQKEADKLKLTLPACVIDK